MRFIYPTLACFLHACLSGCMDYIKIGDESVINASFNFPPMIDKRGLSPPPQRLTETISVGKNCKGQVFKVPPIADRNSNDRLYYLWFIDDKLGPVNWIEPENRESAIITLNVDEQFLISLFENKFPNNFFSSTHTIEFFVSDKPYDIPERQYQKKADEKNHGDYAYWIITFSNGACG